MKELSPLKLFTDNLQLLKLLCIPHRMLYPIKNQKCCKNCNELFVPISIGNKYCGDKSTVGSCRFEYYQKLKNRRLTPEQQGKYRDRSSKKELMKSIRNWEKRNIEKVRIWKENCRLKRKGVLGIHTPEEWVEKKGLYDFTCYQCNKREPDIVLTKDHIIPISKGGSNYIENLQPLCSSCNSSKSTKIQFLSCPL